MVKNQLGGKIIDSGTYGCINYPALPCWSKERLESNQYSDKNYVSKIMTINESEYEIKNIKEIKKVDYLDIFTLGKIKVCSPKEFSEKKDNLSKCNIVYKKDILKNKNCNKTNCKYTHSLNSNYSIILMPKLEYTVYDMMLKVIDSKKNVDTFIFKGLDTILNLFYACAFLANNSFLHFDIKENNIGFDGAKPVLFDFGLSLDFEIGKKLLYSPSRRISQSMDYYMYQMTCAIGLDKVSIDLDKSLNKSFQVSDHHGKENYNKICKWINNYDDTNHYIDVKSLAKLYNLSKEKFIEKQAKTLMIIYGYCLAGYKDEEKYG